MARSAAYTDMTRAHNNQLCRVASIILSDNYYWSSPTALPSCMWALMDRDSSVSIATHYGLDALGIESRWGQDFPRVQAGPGAHPASCTIGTGSFPGVKRPGHGVDHPSQSSAEVKERV
jgi:hypothetical protein